MSERRRGLGRGLGALIPTASDNQRPVDVFFPAAPTQHDLADEDSDPRGAGSTAGSDPAEVRSGAKGSAESSPEPGGTGPEDDSSSGGTSGGSTRVPGEARHGGRQSGRSSSARTGTGLVEAGSDLLPVPGAQFAEIPVDDIQPNARQPRTVFDEDDLAELVGSIREVGVLQPVVVRLAASGSTDGAPYELIMGERRWRASREAGLATVPAIIRQTDDADLLRDALLENLHRAALNPLEEAAAYQQLLDDFGCTHEELAARISRSRPQISNTLRLLKLPPLVQRRVAAGVLSAGHARALLGLADGAAIERLAQRIVAEGLSVRATEEIVSLGGLDASPAPARRPRAGQRSEAVDELAGRLSDRFETRVKVELGKSKGKVTVEFASVDDLNRILQVLAPDDPGLFPAGRPTAGD